MLDFLSLIPGNVLTVVVAFTTGIFTLIAAFVGFYFNSIILLKEKKIQVLTEDINKLENFLLRAAEAMDDINDSVFLEYNSMKQGKSYIHETSRSSKKILSSIIRVYFPNQFIKFKEYSEALYEFHKFQLLGVLESEKDHKELESILKKFTDKQSELYNSIMSRLDNEKEKLETLVG